MTEEVYRETLRLEGGDIEIRRTTRDVVEFEFEDGEVIDMAPEAAERFARLLINAARAMA